MIVEGERQGLSPIIQEEIGQIARELIRNAFRHARAHEIEAELRYDTDVFRLIVRDDGKGIAPEILRDGGCAGHWGMPGVHERARGIGARLEFWSQAGAGTEVRLTVPAAVAYEGRGVALDLRVFRNGGQMGSSPNLIRILTVDDHPLLREGIAFLVKSQQDMELVAEASDGEEAIEQFRRHRPDVTLMDLRMPNLNGTEAISRIRNEFPDAKIIVLSTYAGDVQVLKAIKAGARGYIVKGHVHRELLEAIRRSMPDASEYRPRLRRSWLSTLPTMS